MQYIENPGCCPGLCANCPLRALFVNNHKGVYMPDAKSGMWSMFYAKRALNSSKLTSFSSRATVERTTPMILRFTALSRS